MADPERLFRDALVADLTAMGVLDGGVHIFRVPPKTALPYAVITLISETRDAPLIGADTLPMALLDVEVIAGTAQQLGLARGAIRVRMDGFAGGAIAACRLENQFADDDQDAELFRATLSYRVIYEEND